MDVLHRFAPNLGHGTVRWKIVELIIYIEVLLTLSSLSVVKSVAFPGLEPTCCSRTRSVCRRTMKVGS